MNYQDMTKEELIEYIYKKEGKLIYQSEKINYKLVSINNAYIFVNGRKIKNKESRDFDINTNYLIEDLSKILENNKTYRIYVEMYVNLQNSDVDNRFKLLLDMIEEKTKGNGFTDKQFVRVEGEKFKVKREEQGFKFYIYEYNYDKDKSLKFNFPSQTESKVKIK
jgi:hypothetical protein